MNARTLFSFILAIGISAQTSAGVGRILPTNPGEPFGCNMNVIKEEYNKSFNQNLEAAKKQNKPEAQNCRPLVSGSKIPEDLLRAWMEKNPPKKPLIVMFGAGGQRIGCIENPDTKAKDNKLVIVSDPIIGEGGEVIIDGKDVDVVYKQDELKKIYHSASILRTVEMNDPFDIYNTKRLNFPEPQINGILDNSGVGNVCLTKNPKATMEFFKKESRTPAGSKEGGKLDFYVSNIKPNWGYVSSQVFDGEEMFLVGRKSYNTRDFGNYLWGGAMKRACFPCTAAKLAAHVNNIKNMWDDNPYMKENLKTAESNQCLKDFDGVELKKQKKIVLDSPTDQKAIWNGCSSIYNDEKRSLTSCEENFEFSGKDKKVKGKLGYYITDQGSKILEVSAEDGRNLTYQISYAPGGRSIRTMENGKLKASKFIPTDKYAKFRDSSDEQLLKDEFLAKDLTDAAPEQKHKEQLTLGNHISNVLKVNCGHVMGHSVAVLESDSRSKDYSDPIKLCKSRKSCSWTELEDDTEIEESYGGEFAFDSKDRQINRLLKRIAYKLKRDPSSKIQSEKKFYCKCPEENSSVADDNVDRSVNQKPNLGQIEDSRSSNPKIKAREE